MSAPDLAPYDAVLLVSFGGPEGPEDVLPFMENVTRGRGIPPERLAEVSRHYFHFGGRSPINDHNRALQSALRSALAVPVYWGNRHWHPYLSEEVARMAAEGVERALAIVTSAFSSYSGCRQYLDDIAAARARIGEGAPVIDKVRAFYDHPGFIHPMIDSVRASWSPGDALLFSAHSIPLSMADTSPYVEQLREACRLIAAGAGVTDWELVYQSRSGPPQVPWLEPDVGDRIDELAAAGVRSVVVAPVGFVSDHMEVVWDLDTQAAERAAASGVAFTRAATAGADPRFAAGLVELCAERAAAARGEDPARAALGTLGCMPDACPPGCCPASRR